jgi:hypothetical protein
VLSHREEAWDTKEEVEDMEVNFFSLCLSFADTEYLRLTIFCNGPLCVYDSSQLLTWCYILMNI